MKKCVFFFLKLYAILFIGSNLIYCLLKSIEFNNATNYYCIYLFFQGLLFIGVVLFAKKKYRIKINLNAFRISQKSIVFLIITVFLAIGMHLLYTVEFYIYTTTEISLPIGFGFTWEEFENLYNNSIFMCIISAVFYPILEELFFRGILFNYFRREGTLKTAIIGSCLIFSAFHGKFAPFVFFTTLLITNLYYKSNNIIYPCIFHIVNNSLSIILGQKKIVGIGKDMTGLILSGGIILVLSLGALYKYSKYYKV